jgi:hypothetical protein
LVFEKLETTIVLSILQTWCSKYITLILLKEKVFCKPGLNIAIPEENDAHKIHSLFFFFTKLFDWLKPII